MIKEELRGKKVVSHPSSVKERKSRFLTSFGMTHAQQTRGATEKESTNPETWAEAVGREIWTF